MSLEHEATLCPITALAFCEDVLLAGEGFHVKAFDPLTHKCLFQDQIFDSQAVHGIATQTCNQGNVAVVWGGRNLCVFYLTKKRDERGHWSLEFGPKHFFDCGDWILDVTWWLNGGKGQGDEHVAHLVTAHNALVEVKAKRADHGNLVLQSRALTSTTRTLLYTARLKWITSSHLLVAAGTAFGELVVWSFHSPDGIDEVEGNPQIKIHHVFSAHDGSIYGIGILLGKESSLDLPRLLIATCSDDRTIRLWDSSMILQERLQPHSNEDHRLDKPYDTALPQPLWGRTQYENSSAAPCLARTWAHGSRVWRVDFLEQSMAKAESAQDTIIYLVSFGEDANCEIRELLWEGDIKSKLPACLKKICHFSAHNGKNSWSHVLCRRSEEEFWIFSGGADGAIAKIDLSASSQAESSWAFAEAQNVWRDAEVSDDRLESELSVKVRERRLTEGFKSYTFIEPRRLLITTQLGDVLLANIELSSETSGRLADDHRNSHTLDWRYLGTYSELSQYSVTTGIPELGLAFLAGYSGRILMVNSASDSVSVLGECERKVGGIYAQSKLDPRRNAKLAMVLVSLQGSDVAKFYRVSISEGCNISIEESRLQLHSMFVVTSMVCSSEVIIIGSRGGYIAVYDVPSMDSKPDAVTCRLNVRCHDDAITCMQLRHPKTSEHDNGGLIFTTARDGCVGIFQIPSTSSDQVVSKLHYVALPLGPHLEGSYIRSSDDHLIVYGFKGLKFAVYDVTDDREITSVDCGGAHRQWSLYTGGDTDCTLLWTRATHLNLCVLSFQALSIIKPGGHGREIKAAAICPREMLPNQTIIATGSEDTDIRMFEYCHFNRRLRQAAIVRRHVTGVQKLRWSSSGRYLFSCGGCEELFVWRIRRLPWVGIGIVCETVMPPASELMDLRTMDFDVYEAAESDEQSHFLISVVFSDSTFRRYDLLTSPEKAKWIMIHDGRYTSCCLTQAAHVATPPLEQPKALVTAATDGNIALWELPEAGDQVGQIESFKARCQLHQNSIKCLVARSLTDGRGTEIFTGGDDNAIAISIVNAESFSKRANFLQAHAASITGLALITQPTVKDNSKAEQERRLLASVSNDQRLKLWNYSGQNIQKIAAYSTPVADASCLELISIMINNRLATKLVVCGVGIQIWHLT